MIHVVRHAHAGSRRSWNGDDSLRPLSRRGLAEAEALAARLTGRLTAIFSSPYLRCVQTMRPAAAATGLTLDTADWLGEGASLGRVLSGLEALSPGAAVCSHGDVIGDLVEHLARLGVPLTGPIEWRKGSVWHLETERGRIVSGRYEAPPQVSAER